MYNKTIIRFGFCDIQNNQGLGKGYQPQPKEKPHPIIVYYYATGVNLLQRKSSGELFFTGTFCRSWKNKTHKNLTPRGTRSVYILGVLFVTGTINRVAFKKIVSWVIFLLSSVTIFHKRPEETFSFPNLLQHLECGTTKRCVYKMVDTAHGKTTCEMSGPNKNLFQLLYLL